MTPTGAIVTGAAGAIGRAIAMRLAQDGWAVVCVDRDERVTRVVQEINAAGGTGASCMVDLTDDHAPWEVLAHSGLIGPISLLVNNAGVTSDARALEMSDDAFRNVVRINAVAPLRLADAVAPHLAEGAASSTSPRARHSGTSGRRTTSRRRPRSWARPARWRCDGPRVCASTPSRPAW
jgi:NAD(P)-dependent dehydrogenase (short-subunit alcohol dehydrogenase family)